MREIEKMMQEKAAQLLADGTVNRVLAWRAGEFFYDKAPAVFENADACAELVYDSFCAANLSKYLMESSKAGIKTAVFLKPCDTYGLNQLLKDRRVKRELVHAIGTPCVGIVDYKKLKKAGCKGIQNVEVDGDEVVVTTRTGEVKLAKNDVLLDKCLGCKGKAFMIADEVLEAGEWDVPHTDDDKFAEVKTIEAMTPAERFAFWQKELSRCIRCNACRDICPACSCEQCIFDKKDSPVAGKAYADPVEEQLFHIIRAYHVAGRCTGCGECARVCPQGIRIDLLNKKFTKDINTFFGPFLAGADAVTPAPLIDYEQGDVEANVAGEGGAC